MPEPNEPTSPDPDQPKDGSSLAEPGTQPAKWAAAEWRGKMLLDLQGEKIGKLQDVYVDVETDEPTYVRSAPDTEPGNELSQADESTLYHHFEINYTPPDTESGRRLARR